VEFLAASGRIDGVERLVVWDIHNGFRPIVLAETNTTGPLGTTVDIWPYLAFTPDGKWLVAGVSAYRTSDFKRGEAKVCDKPESANGAWLIGLYKHGSASYNCVAFSNCGRWIAMGSDHGFMCVPVLRNEPSPFYKGDKKNHPWNQERHYPPTAPQSVLNMALSPDGCCLAVCGFVQKKHQCGVVIYFSEDSSKTPARKDPDPLLIPIKSPCPYGESSVPKLGWSLDGRWLLVTMTSLEGKGWLRAYNRDKKFTEYATLSCHGSHLLTVHPITGRRAGSSCQVVTCLGHHGGVQTFVLPGESVPADWASETSDVCSAGTEATVN
jgi:WD40 repeat protein